MTNCNAEIFRRLAKNPEVQQKDSKIKNREALAGVFLFLIVLPESLIYFEKIKIALLLYAGILVTLSLISTSIKETEVRNVFQAFLLLPILRLINFSVPFFPGNPLFSFVFIYTPIMIPLTIIVVRQHLTYKQLGINFENIVSYLPASIFIGFIFGLGESFVMQTTPLIPDLSITNILELIVIMIFFVGVTEEFLFRSVLQTRFEEMFGIRGGLVLSGLIFGLMHFVYGTLYAVFYAFATGLIIGYIFYRTRSLPFIALIHGFINVFSFGIIPHLGHGLGIF